MNNYIALSGYLALMTFYFYELSEHLYSQSLRRALIHLLAVIGYGLLVCHFVLEASAATAEPPSMRPRVPVAAPLVIVREGPKALPDDYCHSGTPAAFPVVYESGRGSMQALRACGSGLDEDGRQVAGPRTGNSIMRS